MYRFSGWPAEHRQSVSFYYYYIVEPLGILLYLYELQLKELFIYYYYSVEPKGPRIIIIIIETIVLL